LLTFSEQLVNALNERARHDALAVFKREVDDTEHDDRWPEYAATESEPLARSGLPSGRDVFQLKPDQAPGQDDLPVVLAAHVRDGEGQQGAGDHAADQALGLGELLQGDQALRLGELRVATTGCALGRAGDQPVQLGDRPGVVPLAGADPGTQHYGLVEKVLTLDIAQRLRTLLVAQGWTVRMTRETDVDPVSAENIAKMRADGKANPDDRAYLQTRCDVANNAGARLFISIHVNSAPLESARGTTVYWYKPQDAAFAQALERSVIPVAGTQDDGTRHENFYVVRHTTMPSVLIETAFVTNPDDVALLRSPSFLQNVAQGIANGVKAYAGAPGAQPLSLRQ